MFGIFSKAIKPATVPRGRDHLGCFGKMPIHADFIRHGVRAREVIGLESWVQEGVGLLSRRQPRDGHGGAESFACHHLVMNGGEQERTLVGTLSASRDRSGRSYPFVMFCLADEPLFRDMQAAVPIAFDHFFHDTAEISAAPWSQEPLKLLIDRIDGIASRDTSLNRRRILERQIQMLGDIPMGVFWSQTFAGTRAHRIGLFEALFSALRSAARRGPARVTWGLRFPLPQGRHLFAAVVFWVQMVEAILEERHWRAHYFWNAGGPGQAPSLTLFFRPLAASLFLWLLPNNTDEGGLLDLRYAMEQRSDVRCSTELAGMLGDDDVCLLDILYRAGRREVLS